MTLAPGSRVGSYEVTALLGAGGMGEVYQAHDTSLGRDVALKLLPPAFTDDPERLARFEREARTLASLNHPHIGAIYGLERHAGLPVCVLELVPGDTLADRIARGPMTVSETTRAAHQIAEALEAAHEKGIVHRDLKPANIKIAADGSIKVLDFGLAKVIAVDAGDVSQAPTATIGGTSVGVVLGTAAYMSPEQARGLPVDKRTDVWAFGCVLFEMLTGQRAFPGSTVSDVLVAVLERDPDWSRLPAHAGLRRLLRRCLEKDTRQRLRDIADARLELEDAGRPQKSRKARLVRGSTIAALAAVVIVGVAAWEASRRLSEPARTGDGLPAFSVAQLTSQPGAEWFPSLSPDGKWIVYGGGPAGNHDVYLQSVTGQNPVNLTPDSPVNDDEPSFSPDGERIAFRSARDGGGIFVMGRTGEAARRLTRRGYRPAWSPDGRRIAYSTEDVDVNPQNGRGPSELWIVDVDSGREARVGINGVQVAWSPHGHRLAVAIRSQSLSGNRVGNSTMSIVTLAVEGGTPAPAVREAATSWNPAWSPDGRYLYFSSDRGGSMGLWRVPIEEESGDVRGRPEPLVAPTAFAAHPALSADGQHVAFSSVINTTNIVKFSVDRSGVFSERFEEVTSGSRPWSSPDPSPDGESVVFYSRENPEGRLFVSRMNGGLRQLTPDTAIDRVPRWSPDGSFIVFFSDRGGLYHLWSIRPDGSDLRQISRDTATYAAWSPDARRIATTSYAADSEEQMTYVFDPQVPVKEQKVEVLPRPGFAPHRFVVNSWSPDGSQLAGTTSLGATGIATYSFSSRKYEQFTDYGEFPVWFDNTTLMFVSEGRHVMLLDTKTRAVRRVFTASRGVLGPARLSADRHAAFASLRLTEADIWMLTFNGKP